MSEWPAKPVQVELPGDTRRVGNLSRYRRQFAGLIVLAILATTAGLIYATRPPKQVAPRKVSFSPHAIDRVAKLADSAPLPPIPTNITIAQADALLDSKIGQWGYFFPEIKMAILWRLAEQMHAKDGRKFWHYRARLYFYVMEDEEAGHNFDQNLTIRQFLKAADDFNTKIPTWRMPSDFDDSKPGGLAE